jgi:hypothetical protein
MRLTVTKTQDQQNEEADNTDGDEDGQNEHDSELDADEDDNEEAYDIGSVDDDDNNVEDEADNMLTELLNFPDISTHGTMPTVGGE